MEDKGVCDFIMISVKKGPNWNICFWNREVEWCSQKKSGCYQWVDKKIQFMWRVFTTKKWWNNSAKIDTLKIDRGTLSKNLGIIVNEFIIKGHQFSSAIRTRNPLYSDWIIQ